MTDRELYEIARNDALERQRKMMNNYPGAGALGTSAANIANSIANSNTFGQKAWKPRNFIEIGDSTLSESDVKELKALLEFVRFVIDADPRFREYWQTYRVINRMER